MGSICSICNQVWNEGRFSQQCGLFGFFGCEGDEGNGPVMDMLCIEAAYPTAIIDDITLKQGERLDSTLFFLYCGRSWW